MDCAFKRRICSLFKLYAGPCTSNVRFDKISVIFKEINNMENNQLTIDIPEGMEIDLENSNLAKGIVKFKKKYITYDDILQVTDSVSVRISTYCVDKLLAISKLMDIAKYYNGDWEPDWDNQNEYKYSIVYNRGIYKVDYGLMTIFSNIYFKNKKDAQAVIDNPNFRDILDAVYKN